MRSPLGDTSQDHEFHQRRGVEESVFQSRGDRFSFRHLQPKQEMLIAVSEKHAFHIRYCPERVQIALARLESPESVFGRRLNDLLLPKNNRVCFMWSNWLGHHDIPVGICCFMRPT